VLEWLNLGTFGRSLEVRYISIICWKAAASKTCVMLDGTPCYSPLEVLYS